MLIAVIKNRFRESEDADVIHQLLTTLPSKSLLIAGRLQKQSAHHVLFGVMPFLMPTPGEIEMCAEQNGHKLPCVNGYAAYSWL